MLLFIVALVVAFALRVLWKTTARARPRFRFVILPVLAAALQLAIGVPPLHQLDRNGRFAVVVASYAVVGIWLVVNAAGQMRPLRGAAAMLSLGWLMNVIAIVANRGMPVSRSALAAIGVRHASIANGNLYKHVLSSHATVLPWLGDVIPVPIPVLRNVVSVGDVVIFLGTIFLVRHVELHSAAASTRSNEAVVRPAVMFDVSGPP